jgi:hypothetical protein
MGCTVTSWRRPVLHTNSFWNPTVKVSPKLRVLYKPAHVSHPVVIVTVADFLHFRSTREFLLRLIWWPSEIHKVSLFLRKSTCTPAYCFEVRDPWQFFCLFGRVTLSTSLSASIAYRLTWKYQNLFQQAKSCRSWDKTMIAMCAVP